MAKVLNVEVCVTLMSIKIFLPDRLKKAYGLERKKVKLIEQIIMKI